MSPIITKDTIHGQIIYIDQFGNLITNIKQEDFPQPIHGGNITIKTKKFEINQFSNSYSDAKQNAPLAIWGSHGYLELALNQKRANDVLDLVYGDQISINWT